MPEMMLVFYYELRNDKDEVKRLTDFIFFDIGSKLIMDDEVWTIVDYAEEWLDRG